MAPCQHEAYYILFRNTRLFLLRPALMGERSNSNTPPPSAAKERWTWKRKDEKFLRKKGNTSRTIFCTRDCYYKCRRNKIISLIVPFLKTDLIEVEHLSLQHYNSL